MYNFRRAPIVQRTEQSTPKALMWVQFPLGAPGSNKTSQNSDNIERFLAGLRFVQRGKLDELPIRIWINSLNSNSLLSN